jgi:hypothetical protein
MLSLVVAKADYESDDGEGRGQSHIFSAGALSSLSVAKLQAVSSQGKERNELSYAQDSQFVVE